MNEPTRKEKGRSVDPDLQVLEDNWPYLTKWQRKKIYYKVRYEMAKIRVKSLYKSLAFRWFVFAGGENFNKPA